MKKHQHKWSLAGISKKTDTNRDWATGYEFIFYCTECLKIETKRWGKLKQLKETNLTPIRNKE